MTNANQPRAYIVHLTDERANTVLRLNDEANPQLLDTDALRLVLEAAKWAQETKDDGRNGGEDFVVWENTRDAIAKISSLI